MKDHISITQIEMYMNCSLKYKRHYIEEIPPLFIPAGRALGAAVHTGIEWFNRKRKEGKEVLLEDIWRIFEADWQALSFDQIAFKDGQTEKDILDLGKNLLSLYYSDPGPGQIKEVEHLFEVPLVDPKTNETLEIPLVGVFDLVEEKPTVVEIKTSSQRIDQQALERHLQLTAYSYAFFMKYHELPELRLDVLFKFKTPYLERFTTFRTQEDHRRFFHLVKEVLKGIKEEVFFPNPGWWCKECEYRQRCWYWNSSLL